jgi:tRNA(Met) C34 N-acetyltransferase TmcA
VKYSAYGCHTVVKIAAFNSIAENFISKFKAKFKHIYSILPETTIASLGPQVSKPTIAKTTAIYNKIGSNKQ